MVEWCLAQEDSTGAIAEERAVETQTPPVVPARYNIALGAGGLKLSAGLEALYIDNVFLTHEQTRDDFILVPQLNAGAFLPVGQINLLRFDVGLAYYEYLKNTKLNSGTPTISPNSDLEFHIHAGDFQITLSEAFSYQETPFYDTGGQFFNVYNSGRFARYDNRVGASARWDLHHLVLDAGYHHEDLLSDGSLYNFIDRHSEVFDADAFLAVTPVISVGLEAAGSFNSFDHVRYNDHWRAGAGPGLKLRLSDYLNARFGGGYQRIQYDSALDGQYGLDGFNTYYAYGILEHELNKFFSHSLKVWHDNQIGINAANLAGSHVTYSLSWKATEKLTLSPYFEYSHYEESYGPGLTGLYREIFDYFSGGVSAGYALNESWRFNVSYDYRLKDSEFVNLGYTQNRVTLAASYQF